MAIHLLINSYVFKLSALQNRKLRNKRQMVEPSLHAIVTTASKLLLFANMSLNLSTYTQEGRLLSSHVHVGVANLKGTISGKQCCCGNETKLPKRDFFGANFLRFLVPRSLR